MTTPLTKTARHARIADILAREQVRSQEELADLLERYAGVHVTQATLSRCHNPSFYRTNASVLSHAACPDGVDVPLGTF